MGVRKDQSLGDEKPHYLHSLLFLGMDTEQVKLLGNYIVHLINQCEEDEDEDEDDVDAKADEDAEDQSED